MQLPADLLRAPVGGNITNVLTDTTLVAAPGAGLRLRIWLVTIRGSTASVGAATIEHYYTDSAFSPIGTQSWANPVGPVPITWPGGFALPTNTLFNLRHVASAAGPFAFQVVTCYTVEAV